MTNSKTNPLFYTEIRTADMLPDRSSDLFFEPNSSMTQQQFADECDINNIVASNASYSPMTADEYSRQNFTDFGDGMDFQSHQNYMAEANSAFFSLPSEMRARFRNNPAELFEFIHNPANQEEAYNLGLAKRPEPSSESVLSDEPTPPPAKPQKAPKTPPNESGE